MIIDFLLLFLAFYLSIPLAVAYAAHCYGRSFWLWFTLGIILPIISYALLYILLIRDSKKQKIIALMKPEEISYMEQQIKELKVEHTTRRKATP